MTSPRAKRGRWVRVLAWSALYATVLALFVGVLYWQGSRVNTLELPAGTLSVATSKTSYTVGDTIAYTITNNLTVPVTFVNNCPNEPLYVYTWKDSSWQRIHDTAKDNNCATQAARTTIQPHGTLSADFSPWVNLFSTPGIYRIVILPTNYTALPYADFQVVSKPTPAPAPVTQVQRIVIYQPVYTPIYVPSPTPAPSGGGDGGGD